MGRPRGLQDGFRPIPKQASPSERLCWPVGVDKGPGHRPLDVAASYPRLRRGTGKLSSA